MFFSSHLLYEIEPVADQIAILEDGYIIHQSATDKLRNEVKQLIFTRKDFDKLNNVPGVLDVKLSGRQAAVIVKNINETQEFLVGSSISFNIVDLNLDEIFETYVIGNRGDGIQ